MPSPILVLLTALVLNLSLSACSRKAEDAPAYQAGCHGPPLRTLAQRNQAQEDGYEINREHDCIDKASYIAVRDQRARWEASNTPEAIAERRADRGKMAAEERARAATAIQSALPRASPPPFTLKHVDANTASEAELASVPSVSPAVASQIMAERNKRRFDNWADLIGRVVGLSAAQTAVYASACGLNVDGQTLPDASPDSVGAAQICDHFHAAKHP